MRCSFGVSKELMSTYAHALTLADDSGTVLPVYNGRDGELDVGVFRFFSLRMRCALQSQIMIKVIGISRDVERAIPCRSSPRARYRASRPRIH